MKCIYIFKLNNERKLIIFGSFLFQIINIENAFIVYLSKRPPKIFLNMFDNKKNSPDMATDSKRLSLILLYYNIKQQF